jgi:hypothetical protein
MSLSDKAREAREHAGTCTDPFCHRLALALEAAERAESDAVLGLALPMEPADLTGIPDPPVKEIRIPKPRD